MRVQFWGTRGSIAKPGPTTARYGGNTSCVEIRSSRGTLIVTDCGTGAHALGQALLKESPKGVRGHLLISHTHPRSCPHRKRISFYRWPNQRLDRSVWRERLPGRGRGGAEFASLGGAFRSHWTDGRRNGRRRGGRGLRAACAVLAHFRNRPCATRRATSRVIQTAVANSACCVNAVDSHRQSCERRTRQDGPVRSLPLTTQVRPGPIKALLSASVLRFPIPPVVLSPNESNGLTRLRALPLLSVKASRKDPDGQSRTSSLPEVQLCFA